jgi:flagellar hook protein FlgE
VPAGYTKTNVATDLAVSGPGYLVLSTKRNPTMLEDLFFTRKGHLKLQNEVDNGLTLTRLMHTANGTFYLLGYQAAGSPAGDPVETTGISEGVLSTTWGGTAIAPAPLSLDADRNAKASTDLNFTSEGQLLMGTAAPHATDGRDLTAYVVLAQFTHPESLSAVSGIDGFFRYNANAGPIFMGVAGLGRPVGAANLILPATLEGH